MRRLTLLLLLLVAASVALAYRELRRPLLTAESEPRVLVVSSGANAATIGDQLAGLGLVRHPMLFRALVRVRNSGRGLKAGHYTLRGPMTLVDVLDELERGSPQRFDITFPEGKNIEEMARIAAAGGVDEAAFLTLARDGAAIHDLDPEATDLEGYLFPDTYDVPPTADRATELVGQMLRRFRSVLAQLPFDEAETSVRQLVTIASLVELETARADERPRIAAVFLNRLDRGMPLQTDPTVIYALRLAGTYDGNIRKQDLSIDSPYNTYRYPGLPPGPIAAPGRDAMAAVLDPADVKDLYFVSRNDGSHEFSRTLRDHERAVDEYQRRRRSSSARKQTPDR